MLDNENVNAAGRSFTELGEEEMLEVIGGVNPGDARGSIIIIGLTKYLCLSAVGGLLTFAVC